MVRSTPHSAGPPPGEPANPPREPRSLFSASPEARGFSDAGEAAGMEAEVYASCGALFGTLELLAADAVNPLDTRQRAWVTAAMRQAEALRHRLEALLLLSEVSEFKCLPGSLKRVVEHAVRGASLRAGARGVGVALPPASAWPEALVLLDATRLDWMFLALADLLVASLNRGDRLRVEVETAAGSVCVALVGERCGPESRPVDVAPLLWRAWQRLVALHGGRLELVPGGVPALRVTLPLAVDVP